MWSRRKDNMRLNCRYEDMRSTGVARERRQLWNRMTIRCKCVNMAIYNWMIYLAMLHVLVWAGFLEICFIQASRIIIDYTIDYLALR